MANKGVEPMAKVAQEVVRDAGINIEELLKKLVRAAAAEFIRTIKVQHLAR